ncbi:Rapid ALkalinization Factor [Heracleum sosnowskyi]|uniref:Rapid ALkalinization Factor n=1 Tax=Heracleum sosnowskyi TaxID=360622 RepID=A0AAD8J7R3_9APIA|nr:Rapid ALkalinization Factor [Heracleum sosnowskyi]
MANSSGLLLIILCALFVSTMVSSSASGYDWMDLKQGCKGSIAECMGVGEEFEMDSESNRRILATSNYISYAALQKNNVPCSKRGASYYNCKQGAEANPYNRGCSAITRCRS